VPCTLDAAIDYNLSVFAHSVSIPENSLSTEWEALWSQIPTTTAVFALYGQDAASEPYITKTANLRRRLKRLLSPDSAASKRLNLAGRIRQVAFTETGSALETTLLLYAATRQSFGDRARKRLHLRPPAVLRYTEQNAYPRVFVTNRIALRSLAYTYGPFPSRVAAERFLDESLNLFELRRCVEDLHPDPAFPGCIYSEMKMCLAPCFKGCSDERYAAEAEAVRNYFATRGASLLATLEQDRNAASTALDFEKAAQLHARLQKVKAIAQQAAPLVHPLDRLDAVVLQLAADAEHVAMFRVRAGRIFGPALYSVQGMLHPNEQSGSSSLFAHPTSLAPTPLESEGTTPRAARSALEERLRDLLQQLETSAAASRPNADGVADHLAILARWYYRPTAQRTGEIFFCDASGNFPLPKILRGISRVFRGAKNPEDAETPSLATTEISPSTSTPDVTFNV
jgi:hypothetical protein